MAKTNYQGSEDYPELAASPGTPASGWARIYAKNNGFYAKDDTGREAWLSHGIEKFEPGIKGAITVQTGTSRFYFDQASVFESMRASVGVAPTGAALRVDVNKNGTTIYTTNGNRPNVAVSTFTATANAPDVTTFAAGDYITFDVDIIGSTIAGSDLVCCFRYRVLP